MSNNGMIIGYQPLEEEGTYQQASAQGSRTSPTHHLGKIQIANELEIEFL